MVESVKQYKATSLPNKKIPNAIVWVRETPTADVKGYISDINGNFVPLKDLMGGGSQVTNEDGSITIVTLPNSTQISVSTTLKSLINGAIQPGDTTSELLNNGSDGTSTYVEANQLAGVAFSGDYEDLDNLPNLNDYYLASNPNGYISSVVADLGYTPENQANKQNSFLIDGTGQKYYTVDYTNNNIVPNNRTITIDGISYDLSTNRSWNTTNSSTITRKSIVSTDLVTQDVSGFLTYINSVTPFSIASNEHVVYEVSDTGQKFLIYLNNVTVGTGQPALISTNISELEEEGGIEMSQWQWALFYSANSTVGVFNGFALNSGTIGMPVGVTVIDNYQNMKQFFSSTSANSGYRYLTITASGAGSSRFFVQKGLTYFATFCIYDNSNADTIVRLGFLSSLTQADSSFGAYIEITGSSVVFKTANSGVRSTSASATLQYSATITSEIPYDVMIYFETTTLVRCKIKKYDGTIILDTFLTTNIPLPSGSSFHSGAVGSITTAGTARPIYGLQKIGLGIKKPNFLKNF